MRGKDTLCACRPFAVNKGGVCVMADCSKMKAVHDEMVTAAARASLALDVYDLYDKDKSPGWQSPWGPPSGYTLLSNQLGELRQMFPGWKDATIQQFIAPDGSDYRAAIYRGKDGSLVLAFRGTTSLKDWEVNNENARQGKATDYFSKAEILGRELKKYADLHGLKMEITGHSLGGGMAIAASATSGAPAIVFNPETLSQGVLQGRGDLSRAKDLVTAYTTPLEPLTAAQAAFKVPAPGRHVELPDWPNEPGPYSINRHRMAGVRGALGNQLQLTERALRDGHCPR
ncbi:MAG TPA: hypothetical protein VMI56_10935 [Reyranella sp.]|nr:hypothetical protein [Reyranella sp.]